MKIVILGGSGDMGAATVRDLLEFTDVQQVTIAARNARPAEKLSKAIDDPRLAIQKVDAASHTDLVRIMKKHDVVAGALGPFYLWERPLVEAALAAGVDYVSICDDHDAVQNVLALDQAAAKKGQKILTGLGWTPGITSILARKGYDELDNTDNIRIYWAGSIGDSRGLAVILHTLHIFTGKVTSFQNGRFVEIWAGSGKESVDFPAPLGKITTFHLGHPEPVTLPRYLTGIKGVTLKGGLAENYLHYLAKLMVMFGLTSTPFGKQKLGELMKKMLPFFPTKKDRNFSGARVDIEGTRNGKKIQVSYAVVDRMRRLTGIPLSVGAYMMGQGKIKRCGVFGPEAKGAIDPGIFLQELARRGIKIEHRETLL